MMYDAGEDPSSEIEAVMNKAAATPWFR